MFDSVKNPLQKKSFLGILRFVGAAASVAPGTAIVPKEKIEKLMKADATLITVIGPDPTNAEKVIVQATPAGIQAAAALPAEVPAAPRPAAIAFERVKLSALPEIRRGGNKGDSYPFVDLAAPVAVMDTVTGVQKVDANGVAEFEYDSFFVPQTEGRASQAKSLASTAWSATKRHTSATEARTFTVRKSTDAAKPGVFVIRVK
jgi:hypothetical protein